MANQSSRIYFQGKDHCDIYFRGKYHKAAYIGNQLVWEKDVTANDFVLIFVVPPDNLTIDLREFIDDPYDSWQNSPVIVDCGDGSIIQVNKERDSSKHTYKSAGDYTVKIRGKAYYVGRGSDTGISVRKVLTKFRKNGITIADRYGYLWKEYLLESIPENLFEEFRELTRFDYAFLRCHNLQTIPAKLFSNCKEAMTFDNCFQYCESVTEIPENLFSNCKKVTKFSICFSRCKSITKIPENLFSNCTEVIEFGACFRRCESVTEIPENLFSNCKKATEYIYCFADCYSLTAIPAGLFANCTEATDFEGCFLADDSLTEIPENLFSNCTKATSFVRCFGGCENLRYAPPLWISHPNADGSGCFGGCTKASNYSEIPESWK